MLQRSSQFYTSFNNICKQTWGFILWNCYFHISHTNLSIDCGCGKGNYHGWNWRCFIVGYLSFMRIEYTSAAVRFLTSWSSFVIFQKKLKLNSIKFTLMVIPILCWYSTFTAWYDVFKTMMYVTKWRKNVNNVDVKNLQSVKMAATPTLCQIAVPLYMNKSIWKVYTKLKSKL